MKEGPSTADDYGVALFHLARAAGVVKRVERDLPAVLEFLENNDEVRKRLTGTRLTAEGKRVTLNELLGGAVEPVLLGFLGTVMAKGALGALESIMEAYVREAGGSRDTVWGELTTAWPMDASRVEQIEQELSNTLGRPVRVRIKVNPSVLGGVRIQVGHHVYDGTVDGMLEAAHRALLA